MVSAAMTHEPVSCMAWLSSIADVITGHFMLHSKPLSSVTSSPLSLYQQDAHFVDVEALDYILVAPSYFPNLCLTSLGNIPSEKGKSANFTLSPV